MSRALGQLQCAGHHICLLCAWLSQSTVRTSHSYGPKHSVTSSCTASTCVRRPRSRPSSSARAKLPPQVWGVQEGAPHRVPSPACETLPRTWVLGVLSAERRGNGWVFAPSGYFSDGDRDDGRYPPRPRPPAGMCSFPGSPGPRALLGHSVAGQRAPASPAHVITQVAESKPCNVHTRAPIGS